MTVPDGWFMIGRWRCLNGHTVVGDPVIDDMAPGHNNRGCWCGERCDPVDNAMMPLGDTHITPSKELTRGHAVTIAGLLP